MGMSTPGCYYRQSHYMTQQGAIFMEQKWDLGRVGNNEKKNWSVKYAVLFKVFFYVFIDKKKLNFFKNIVAFKQKSSIISILNIFKKKFGLK